MSTSRAAITATKPLARYIGGKRNLALRLVPLIERTEHTCYAEPFLGMGASSCDAGSGRPPRSSTISPAT